MSILSQKQKFNNFTKTILQLPDPIRSLEECQKFNHDDLLEMDKTELWIERKRIEISLAMLDRDFIFYITAEGAQVGAADWLQERLKKIVDELSKLSNKKTPSRENYKSPAQAQGRAEGWT